MDITAILIRLSLLLVGVLVGYILSSKGYRLQSPFRSPVRRDK